MGISSVRRKFRNLPDDIREEFSQVSVWFFEMFDEHAPEGSVFKPGMAKELQRVYHSAGDYTPTKRRALQKHLENLGNNPLDISKIYEEFTSGETYELPTKTTKPQRVAPSEPSRIISYVRAKGRALVQKYGTATEKRNNSGWFYK